MKIKNVANGGRGIGVASADPKEPGTSIEWAVGEVKDVDDAIIARAKKDPANAAMFEDGGGLVVVTSARVSVNDETPDDATETKKAAKK